MSLCTKLVSLIVGGFIVGYLIVAFVILILTSATGRTALAPVSSLHICL